MMGHGGLTRTGLSARGIKVYAGKPNAKIWVRIITKGKTEVATTYGPKKVLGVMTSRNYSSQHRGSANTTKRVGGLFQRACERSGERSAFGQ